MRLNEPTQETRIPGIKKGTLTGKYHIRIRYRDPKTGKRRETQRTASTLKEAAAIKLQAMQGDEWSRGKVRLRLGDYAQQWIGAHSHQLAPTTRERYRIELGSALETLGDHWLDAIDGSDVREWIGSLGRAGYANASINGRLRVLRQVLDAALADRLVEHNAAKAVRQLGDRATNERRTRALDADELRAYVAEARAAGQRRRTKGQTKLTLTPDVSRIVLAAAWTGARRGEMIGLRWPSIKGGIMTLRESVTGRHRGPTKSGEERQVGIPQPLAEVLAEQRRWLIEVQHPALHTGLVFPGSAAHAKGQARRRGLEVSWYRSGAAVHRAAVAVGRAIGVELTTHSLRRTYEQLLRRAGVDGMVRRSVAGWTREDVQAVYAAIGPEERRSAADALVSLVGV